MPSLPLPSTGGLIEPPRVLVASVFAGGPTDRIVWGLLVGAVALLLIGCTEQRTESSSADAGPGTDSAAVEADPSVWREARRRGVQFRAVGQEPGWLVEVYDDRLRFAWAYGQHEVTVPRAGADSVSEAGRTVYRGTTDRGLLRIVAEERRCTDVMSGEGFSHTVTVTFDGQTYAGCGRPLR